MSPENQWLEDVFPIEKISKTTNLLVFRGVNMLLDNLYGILQDGSLFM